MRFHETPIESGTQIVFDGKGCTHIVGVAQGSEQDTHIRWQVHVFLRTEQKKEELLHELPVRTERGLCLMLRERLMVEVAEEQDKQTGR